MGQLQATSSRGLWRALVDNAERTREPLAHIVSKALAEYLQVAHHTLYQVSTATALVEGIREHRRQRLRRCISRCEGCDWILMTIPTAYQLDPFDELACRVSRAFTRDDH